MKDTLEAPGDSVNPFAAQIGAAAVSVLKEEVTIGSSWSVIASDAESGAIECPKEFYAGGFLYVRKADSAGIDWDRTHLYLEGSHSAGSEERELLWEDSVLTNGAPGNEAVLADLAAMFAEKRWVEQGLWQIQ